MTANSSVATSPRPAPPLPFYGPVLDDFSAVNALIPHRLTSDVHLVEEIGQHLVEAGGKRLRPLLVLLAANACAAESETRVKLAAVIEFLHTATLLHDDVVDSSGLRRGKLTANALWGNAPSVLVGDFVYSRAFQLMVELGQLDILAALAEATNVIAEGEVMQLANIGRLDLSEDDYRTIIDAKTAKLFEAAAHSAALLSPPTLPNRDAQIAALKRYGQALGLAFQLVDDSLDYAG
ncbi:MAG: polyprenyl synthetase family protein, partial [Pseudomonadota bacterium]|nr:polyprenyl synthetase family protein [Pseudomonadota bacterium]